MNADGDTTHYAGFCSVYGGFPTTFGLLISQKKGKNKTKNKQKKTSK